MQDNPFNMPYWSGSEGRYIEEAVKLDKISVDGRFIKRCHMFFEQQMGFAKVLLTTSCTDALELAALLLNLGPGDEAIMPSYTFAGTPNAFMLRWANIVFVDSTAENPNIDSSTLESLITLRTRAVVPVHYAGIAYDMDSILVVATRHGLTVAADAAQAIESYYRGRLLGSLGKLVGFSFHETKKIILGEGMMLIINDLQYVNRADSLLKKGANRALFFRGEVNNYSWVDVGSSFLPSDITAAFLWAQVQNLAVIQTRRRQVWQQYQQALAPLTALRVGLPVIPDYATHNGHIYYLVCCSLEERAAFIQHLREQRILAVFHYLALHKSPYYAARHDSRALPWADHYIGPLVQLPLYYELHPELQNRVIDGVLGLCYG